MNTKNVFSFLITVVFFFVSCSGYLEKKPDNSFTLPQTLEDLEGLLEASELYINFSATSLGEVAADSYYLPTAEWSGLQDIADRMIYKWEPYPPAVAHWSSPYRSILYANTVLQYLPEIEKKSTDSVKERTLRGAALYFRAHQLLNLLHAFSKPYIPGTENQQLGVVLRRDATMTEKLERSSVKDCYDFITNDLLQAAALLPEKRNLSTQPSRAGVYGELARIFLIQGQWENAKKYADSALLIQPDLLNYETDIDITASIPIPRSNKEIYVDMSQSGRSILNMNRMRVSLFEYDNYEETDLRKTAFFQSNADGEIFFKGNYNALSGGNLFCGTTSAEMYLIRAEAAIRTGALPEAVQDVNYLRKHRFKEEDFVPLIFQTKEQAICILKEERRRELIFRGLRWPDMKRYIIQDKDSLSIQREVNGEVMVLRAKDIIDFVYLLPLVVVENGNLEQNIR